MHMIFLALKLFIYKILDDRCICLILIFAITIDDGMFVLKSSLIAVEGYLFDGLD